MNNWDNIDTYYVAICHHTHTQLEEGDTNCSCCNRLNSLQLCKDCGNYLTKLSNWMKLLTRMAKIKIKNIQNENN